MQTKSIISCLVLFLAFSARSQQQVALPNILPPSPEPSSIAKAGNTDVSMSSGTANATIPLYELNLGKHSLPVSLHYSANGYRVDAISSRVGMNWNLSVAGVITRTVRGRPDERSQRVQSPMGNVSLQQLVNYYDQLTLPQYDWDNEPDEYSISAPGLNGRFVLDANGQAVKIPYNNNRIEVTIDGDDMKVVVTDPSGVSYYFGDNGKVERTWSHTVQGNLAGFQQIITALFLTKIQYPDGRFINYNYGNTYDYPEGRGPFRYTVETGISQSLTTGLLSNYTDEQSHCHCTGSLDPMQGGAVGPGTLQTHLSTVTYNSYYLNSISTSDDQTISFTYELRPDGAKDIRVTGINFSCGDFSRMYSLSYDDPPQTADAFTYPGGSLNKNFFLKEVSWQVPIDMDETQWQPLRYIFIYHDLLKVPSRFNFGQDHMGYFNGKPNPTLLPSTENTSTTNWGSQYAAADRAPNANAAKTGMLQRIVHPTGGFEEFEYEGNQYAVNEIVSSVNTVTVSGSGNTINGTDVTSTFYSTDFSIIQEQDANIFFYTFDNPACSNCASYPQLFVARLYLTDLTTNTTTQLDLLHPNSSYTGSETLHAGHTYRLKLEVTGLTYAAKAELHYNSGTGPEFIYANYDAPGLRIKSIKSFDPVSGNQTARYFTYTNGINNNASSAIFLFEPDYISDSYSITLCQSDLGALDLAGCRGENGNSAYETAVFRRKTLSSNSAYLNYGFDGNEILYKNVIESDDAGFANGYIEHKYEGHPIINYTLVSGTLLTNIPTNTVSNTNNYEYETAYYKKGGSLLKKVRNYYSYSSAEYSNNLSALAVNKRQNHVVVDWGSSETMLDPYDVVQYDYRSYWIHLDSTLSIDYDGNNSLVNKTAYYYGNAANTQPVKTESTNSRGDLITTEITYPTDYPLSVVYEAMVSRNILAAVVETKQKKNGSQLTLSRTNYKQWHSSSAGLIIEPETVTMKKGSANEETRIRYYAFDESDNPLEFSKEGDKHVVYIWDYNKRFPVAEVQNAVRADVAYTSFESDGSGNWDHYSGSVMNFGMTGGKCFVGGVSKGVTPSKTYIVTAWCSSSGHVNVNQVSGTPLISKRGWTLYSWEITNASSIDVKGYYFDELRLYPKGAQMRSYTYYPYVGIRNAMDVNCRILYYEYDGAARLRRIRDLDSNIIKQLDYRYGQPILPCTSTLPSWQPTGNVRCVQSGANNNYTGEKEEEKIDLNNCSPGYLQKIWTSIGQQPGCAPVPNCTGPGKRVINGVCQAGRKVLVNSQQTGAHQWQCIYHYVWSDGYVGPNFTETSNTSCAPGGLEDF